MISIVTPGPAYAVGTWPSAVVAGGTTTLLGQEGLSKGGSCSNRQVCTQFVLPLGLLCLPGMAQIAKWEHVGIQQLKRLQSTLPRAARGTEEAWERSLLPRQGREVSRGVGQLSHTCATARMATVRTKGMDQVTRWK